MQDAWLHNLDSRSAVIVPTRTLATHLSNLYASAQIAQGLSVWRSPSIFVWKDFVKSLWQHNLQPNSRRSLINATQSQALWRQLIEASVRNDTNLMLLNVPQTVRAVRISWQLVHDWQIDEQQIRADLGPDSKQLLIWFEEYRSLLAKRFLIDPAQLSSHLVKLELRNPYPTIFWYAYDLITPVQRALNQRLLDQGATVIEHQAAAKDKTANGSNVKAKTFDTEHQELDAALRAARAMLEENSEARIAIVVPDLERRYRQVQDLARDVFYPSLSPAQLSQTDAAYRFSLGQPLAKLPAIQAALSLIEFLTKPLLLPELKLLLRSRFIAQGANSQVLLNCLVGQRLNRVSLAQLAQLVAESEPTSGVQNFVDQVLEFQSNLDERLNLAQQRAGYRALEISEWLQLLQQWLQLWGWRTASSEASLNSEEYQLNDRWNALIEELASLNLVHQRIGAKRLFEQIQQAARETIFLARSEPAPIVISGLLEAGGRIVDQLYLTGMHQDYPVPHNADAFVAKRLLQQAGHPMADPVSEFEHYQQLLGQILAAAATTTISYARIASDQADLIRGSSSLFTQQVWQTQPQASAIVDSPRLVSYQDNYGPPVNNPKVQKGGARIFENQSQCAFKAFAEHRLKLSAEQETEFGLDALDRGNVVHRLLETLWRELKTQESLQSMDEQALAKVVERHIDALLADNKLNFSAEKRQLISHENQRLKDLLLEWLAVDRARNLSFTVRHRELQGRGEIGGIAYRYVIDRIDELEDGRRLVIDYKTGSVSRAQWLDDRLQSPQLPLYALSIDDQAIPIAGIAFGQTKRWHSQYQELAEDEIFHLSTSYTRSRAELWRQRRLAWPKIFEQLAKDFIEGRAQVDPIDENVCRYCDFSRLCRIQQLGAPEHG